MSRATWSAALAVLAVAAAIVGVVYLTVPCQSLPSLLGGLPGDSHPRTPLGAGLTAGAVVLALVAAAGWRWRDGDARA